MKSKKRRAALFFAILRQYKSINLGGMCFVGVGAIFLITSLLGKISGKFAALTFSTFAAIVGAIGAVLSTPFWIFTIIGLANPGAFAWATANWILNLMLATSIVAGSLDLIYDIWRLKQNEQFVIQCSETDKSEYVWGCVITMLSGLLSILFRLMLLAIRAAIAKNKEK